MMGTTQVVGAEENGRPSLGERLAQVRERAGLTQAALAALLGTRQSYISMVETGTRQPSRDLIGRWVSACGRRLDMVFSRVDGAPMAEVSHYLDALPPKTAVMVADLVRLLAMVDEATHDRIATMITSAIEPAATRR
jgi:transcriptional regulator with XRE-family HTH domain